MKFSDISKEKWDELQPYLDTCLLPVTGMNGLETPYEATQCLENLRDIMDLVELPFKGRIVTFPACHYMPGESSFESAIEEWCSNLKRTGFKYVVLITAKNGLTFDCQSADLVVQPQVDGALPTQEEVSDKIRSLWSGKNV
ncbi:DUF2487 family protein [Paenibacillus sp. GSMTC-2017]|uniref:DUF2487 family protein n=1 Tax=Paenibacillus sp. GSMTC-2017 TaxID=2794350 RepID=UPI0018D868A5|nr:DUF2487 family protein [Paenibacillus sp. GSMTC-2017]MBH5317936.1 DUF2487 family protein [Paenibacillus sp. GSMTC-2017]